jgi:predicted permease
MTRLGQMLDRDARYAVRGLRRNPLFTIVAVLTLAIGAGATTAVFGVVDAVLLKPLPYPDSERLVSIWHEAPGATGIADVSGGLLSSLSMGFTYAEHNRVFEHIGLWNQGTANLTGVAEPEEVRTMAVSDGILQALGVPPLHGRWLSAADQEPGSARAIMLTYGYWQRRFGGDPAAVGRSVTIGAAPWEIVGVMPESFRVADTAADVIVPFRADKSQLILPGFGLRGVARLKPGETIDTANADIARMLPIWTASWRWPPGNAEQAREAYLGTWRISPALRPLKQEVVGNVGDVLWVIMGTIGVVLLIACANVANLLLVRAEARSQEFAVRSALGAGAWRISRALLIEGLLLGLLGGAVGLLVAYGAVELLIANAPANLPRSSEIALDARTFGFALAVSVLSGVVLGLIPALKHAGRGTSTALRSGARGSSQGRERHRTQNVVVVGQVALALVLLVSSGLMIRTFDALRTVDPGFTNGKTLQTLRIAIPALLVPEPERVTRMQNDIVDALAALPGVESAGFTTSMPLEAFGGGWDAISVEGQDDVPREARPLRRFRHVSPRLFETSGARLVAGRELTWTDVYDGRPVALVSENLARELATDPSAVLGKRIRLGALPTTQWREVIGVVQDVPDNGLNVAPPAIVYWPTMMTGFFSADDRFLQRAVTVVLRSPRAGTPGFIREIQDAVWSVNPSLPVASVRTMQDVLDASLERTSFTLVMLAIASATALALGVIGLYGVLSYVVSQRRREIAIRLALGAQQGDVTRSFVRHGVVLASVGVAVGLGAAIGVTRLMTSLLFNVQPVDLPTYVIVAIALTVVAAVASYLPARRASGVDPAEALAME